MREVATPVDGNATLLTASTMGPGNGEGEHPNARAKEAGTVNLDPHSGGPTLPVRALPDGWLLFDDGVVVVASKPAGVSVSAPERQSNADLLARLRASCGRRWTPSSTTSRSRR